MRLAALLARGEFHWGFSVRFPATSAASESFLVPPPTTLIGALARGLAELGVLPRTEVYYEKNMLASTASRIMPGVKVATFRYVTDGSTSLPCPYTDPIKLLRAPYQRERGEKKQPFAFCGFGKIYAPGTPFEILYIIDLDFFQKLNCDINKLAAAAYTIPVLGSKESLVSISRVEYTLNVEIVSCSNVREVELSFYCPADAIIVDKSLRALVIEHSLPIPCQSWYTVYGRGIDVVQTYTYMRRFVIPLKREYYLEAHKVNVRCREDAILYKCVFSRGVVYVPWTR